MTNTTDKQKTVVKMVFEDKMSCAEIGRIRGITKSAAAGTKKKALQMIRQDKRMFELSEQMLQILTAHDMNLYNDDLLKFRDFLMVVVRG